MEQVGMISLLNISFIFYLYLKKVISLECITMKSVIIFSMEF